MKYVWYPLFMRPRRFIGYKPVRLPLEKIKRARTFNRWHSCHTLMMCWVLCWYRGLMRSVFGQW